MFVEIWNAQNVSSTLWIFNSSLYMAVHTHTYTYNAGAPTVNNWHDLISSLSARFMRLITAKMQDNWQSVVTNHRMFVKHSKAAFTPQRQWISMWVAHLCNGNEPSSIHPTNHPAIRPLKYLSTRSRSLMTTMPSHLWHDDKFTWTWYVFYF